jgi:hypothetical protein
MFNLVNNNNFPAIVEGYSTTDPVLGGDPGESNIPLKQLTDRTFYLFDRLGRFEDVNIISGSATISAPDKFKLNYVAVSGNATITIDDAAAFPVGAILPFKVKCPQGKAVTFNTSGGQLIEDGNQASAIMWGLDGEEFDLIAVTDHWILKNAKGNFEKVGQDDLLRFQPRNTIIANGCNPESAGALLLRADYPRLWAKVASSAISDLSWLSDPGTRGLFSTGNGSTTFRPPDMRAMFHRGLDLGRGVRLGNLTATPGGYEADGNKSHSHGLTLPLVQHTASSANKGVTDGPSGGSGSVGYSTDLSGDTEARPKNIGFYPVIYV